MNTAKTRRVNIVAVHTHTHTHTDSFYLRKNLSFFFDGKNIEADYLKK